MGDPNKIAVIQNQIDVLIALVKNDPEPPGPPRTAPEERQTDAVVDEWSTSIRCLNLVAAHRYLESVEQCLKTRIDLLKTAVDNKRALRFDVMVLGIASCHNRPKPPSGAVN